MDNFIKLWYAWSERTFAHINNDFSVLIIYAYIIYVNMKYVYLICLDFKKNIHQFLDFWQN